MRLPFTARFFNCCTVRDSGNGFTRMKYFVMDNIQCSNVSHNNITIIYDVKVRPGKCFGGVINIQPLPTLVVTIVQNPLLISRHNTITKRGSFNVDEPNGYSRCPLVGGCDVSIIHFLFAIDNRKYLNRKR